MPQKIHAIYVLSPQISYDTKEQARTFDTLVLFVPYNEPYLIQTHFIRTGLKNEMEGETWRGELSGF